MGLKLERLPGGGQRRIPLAVMVKAIAASLADGSEKALAAAYKEIGKKKETGDPKRIISQWRTRLNQRLLDDDEEAIKAAKAAGLKLVNGTKRK